MAFSICKRTDCFLCRVFGPRFMIASVNKFAAMPDASQHPVLVFWTSRVLRLLNNWELLLL